MYAALRCEATCLDIEHATSSDIHTETVEGLGGRDSLRIDCLFYRSILESGDVAPLVMHDIAMHVLARTYVHTVPAI